MPYLDTFSGSWTAKEARHLLKRTSFGVTQDLVTSSVTLGLSSTINTLFEEKPLPSPPLKFLFDGADSSNDEIEDPGASYGETWVNAPAYPEISEGQNRTKIYKSRNRSLYAWSFLQMQNAEISIREKLTLFWHNHFVSENTNPHREYYYMNVLRTNSLGNFKELVKLVTVDTNMLIYLSGNQNSDAAPNENYSREKDDCKVVNTNRIIYSLRDGDNNDNNDDYYANLHRRKEFPSLDYFDSHHPSDSRAIPKRDRLN